MEKKPRRETKYKSNMILMKKGSMAILIALFGTNQVNPLKTQGGACGAYTQWWVKPYFRYNEIFTKIRSKLSKKF